MKKVVIADDDFLVRTYLKQLIPWEKRGLVIAGDAKNGKEALDLIEREKPYLLITDICMPVLDGIGLIRRAHETGYAPHILVLSCHDDFDYVREAMKLGIDDYILKTELTPEALVQFLQELATDDAPQDASVGADEVLRIGRETLRQNFFEAFRKGAPHLEELGRAAGLEGRFTLAGCLCLSLRGAAIGASQLEEKKPDWEQAFDDMCRDICRKVGTAGRPTRMEPFALSDNRAVRAILLDFPQDAGTAYAERTLFSMARSVRAMAARYFDMDVSIISSRLVRSLEALAREWNRMYAMRGVFYYEHPGCLEARRLALPGAIEDTVCAAASSLIAAIRLGDEAVIDEAAERLYACIESRRPSPELLESWAVQTFAPFSHPWDRTGFSSFASFCEAFHAWLTRVKLDQQRHPAIRMAIRFMEDNSHRDLSQAEVANQVRLNVAYFSTLFKKEMRTGFSEYFARIRFARIKKRLLAGDGKIKDIAREEGFSDYQYFCKLFKRLEGIRPSDYRREIAEREGRR